MTRTGSIMTLMKEAVVGSQKDYTALSIRHVLLLLLAIPMILEMIMASLFALVDVYFFSRLGTDEVSAVGLTESIMMIVSLLALINIVIFRQGKWQDASI